jgi:hypothetical protein
MTRFVNLYRALRAVSFMLLFREIVACSVGTLMLARYVVPYFGWDTSVYQQGAAAGFGALLGVLLAITSVEPPAPRTPARRIWQNAFRR